MQIIPLLAIPSQVVNVTLNNQNCSIEVFQKSTGLFISVACNNTPLIKTKLVRNGVTLLSVPSFKFIGDLVFLDSQGQDDPTSIGLGGRFNLYYLELGDV